MTKPRAYSFKLMSLVSTASLAIAPAAMIGAASVLLTPDVAWAINECEPVGVDPALNLGDPDSYVCSGSYSTTGITYTANGNLFITGNGSMNVGTVGVNLTAFGSDAITWTQTSGTLTGTADEVFNVSTEAGAINLSLGGISGFNSAVTYGVRASSATGPITISTSGSVSTSGAGNIAAIEATNGNGNVNITTDGSVSGREFGIRVQKTGTGTTTINANSSVSINSSAGLAAIRVNNGTNTGTVTVNVGGTSGTVNGQSGSAISITSNGTQNVNISSGRTVSVGNSGIAAIRLFGTGNKNISNSGSLSAGTSGVAVLAEAGNNMTLNNSGTMNGRLMLDGLSGSATVNNTGSWSTNGMTVFNDGASTLNNSGTLTVQGHSTFVDLETFNNSGTIALGSNTLTVADTTFNGTGSSLITLNVTNTGNGQLLLPGGTVTGVTGIRVSGAGVSDTSLFSNDPIVLVDVTGGTIAEGAFVLDSGSANFFDDPVLGGTIISEGSLFALALAVDNEQAVLFSAPSSMVFEYVPALHQTLSAWHTTTELVTGRNAEVRNRDRGMWIRLIGDRTERDYSPSFSSAGQTMSHDANYSFYTGAAIVGFDVLEGSSQSGDYNFGIHGGLVRTRMEFGNSDTTDDMDGVTLGVYGGITNGGLTFDGTVNANLLNLDHNEPTMGDTSTNVISIGGRGEAGYLWPMGGSFYVQPLITGAYVRTSIDELFPKAYEIEYDEVESARAAVGLRIGADAGTAMGPVGFWLTGRLWKEFKDEANVTFSTTGADDFVIVDDLSGEFQELTGGLTLDTGPAAFFLSAGAKFYEQDEFDNYNGSIGVRWRW